MTVHIDPNAAHAVYSASSGHVWAAEDGCTASATAIAAMRRVVPEEESEEALAGTAAHDELERCIGSLNGEFVDPATMPIKPVDPDHPAAHGVALMISFIRQLPPGRMWVEQRVILTKDIWGRADIQHWHEESGTLTIPDLKNGFVGVDAEENEQTRIYAAASIYNHNLPVKWIRHAICQPNDFRPGPRVKQWVESADSLFRFAERVAAIPNGPLTFRAGQHCRDCPLFGTCEPTRDLLKQFAMCVATGTDPTPEQIPLFLACKKPIDHFFEGLMKNGTKKALAGQIPPGMKLVTATKHRTWKSEAEARAVVFAAKGLDALKPPTPSQAEDMGIDVATLATKPDGGPALAFESDKRKPWAAKSAAEMFGSVTAGAKA
ncbi:DUF2800 domain-containing protein [Nitrobacteraceae bacterium UC4446_H13]